MDININKIKNEIGELPQARRERFQKEYSLTEKEVEVFIQNSDFGEYFEKVMSELMNWIKETGEERKTDEKEYFNLAKICANYLITDLQGLLKGTSFIEKNILISPENFAEFVTLIYNKEISSKMAKAILEEMFKTGADPSQIIEKNGMKQVNDESEIEVIVKDVISKNEKAAEDYKKGKDNAFQFLVGQVMAASHGKASPEIVSQILKKFL